MTSDPSVLIFWKRLQVTRSPYIVTLIKSWKDLELVSSLLHWAKNMLEIVVLNHTSISPSFILIGLGIQKK